jgi:hypothetical protein
MDTHGEARGVGPTAFKSKVSRIGPSAPGSSVYLESTFAKNPGPGTYDRISEWELALKKPPQNAVLPWREGLEKTVPSIPPQKLPPDAAKQNTAGADITNIAMRHTGERGDTVGPGEYDPKNDIIVPTLLQTPFAAGGVKDRGLFEPSGAIHNELPPRENPGPGTYDTPSGLAGDASNMESEQAPTHQFSSKSALPYQRTEALERVIPGPGQYENPGHIETAVISARNQNRADRSRFGSNVERIGWHRDVNQPYFDPYHIANVPGPGAYGLHRGTFPDPAKEKLKQAEKSVPGNKKKKYYGVHHPMIVMALQETTGPMEAFGSTDDRACNKVTPQFTPAPWTYSRDEARGQSMSADLREKTKIGRNGAFGSLADRFFGSPLNGRDGLPDPGGMSFNEEAYASGAHTEPKSMFTSQSPRIRDTCPGEVHVHKLGNQDTPAPGAYNIEKEVSYRSPFRTPRADHLSFGTGQGRFDIGRDLFDGHCPSVGNPSPGEYELRLKAPQTHGASAVKDKRNLTQPVGSTTAQVGPGSYGTIDTPMLKKTFNVSTHAPVTYNKTPRRARSDTSKVF